MPSSIISLLTCRSVTIRPPLVERRGYRTGGEEARAPRRSNCRYPAILIVAEQLVIDDQEPIRTLIRIVLERDGYTVVEATDGRIGLELYRNQPADLIVTDILMPEMNGLELILELTREFLNAKVIAMTGFSGKHNRLGAAKLLGARQTLQKPFSMETLLSAVRYELAH